MARHAFPATVMIAVLTTLVSTPALAQETTSGAAVRFVPGIAAIGGVFGDDDPRSVSGLGISIGAQVRGRSANRAGPSFEMAFEPIGVGNPHFDETLRTIYVLAGAEVGRRWFVRPAGGLGVQLWSGSFAETGANVALAMSVAVGRRLERRGATVGIEGVARTSFSIGALSWTLGVQVPIQF